MATSEESVCCREIARVTGKVNELGEPKITCIVHHPGFSPVCLNVCFVLSVPAGTWNYGITTKFSRVSQRSMN